MTDATHTTPEITANSIPTLNKMFRFQWEKAQDCYVLLYPEGMIQLNGPAGEILALVDGRRNLAEITAVLQEKFAEAGDISADILAFIGEAHEQHWITL